MIVGAAQKKVALDGTFTLPIFLKSKLADLRPKPDTLRLTLNRLSRGRSRP